uniref:Uncharacterized protein n=1 Tax=Anguilla anguilla TaxID=7936 RepID=A0A0E9TXD3_ANGAN
MNRDVRSSAQRHQMDKKRNTLKITTFQRWTRNR